MSDKERSLAEQLAELPAAVQDKFLLMAQGAAVAVECAREEKESAAAETGDDLSTASRSPSPEGEAGRWDPRAESPLSGEAEDGGAA